MPENIEYESNLFARISFELIAMIEAGDLLLSEVRLLFFLMRKSNRGNLAYMTQRFIVEECEFLSPATVSSGLRTLRRNGCVKKVRVGGRSGFYIDPRLLWTGSRAGREGAIVDFMRHVDPLIRGR